MADINVHFKDYSYAQVEADYGIICELRDYFSFDVEGAQFNPKVKYGIWDGKIRLMGTDGSLPWGLVNMVKNFASNLDYSIEIDPLLDPKPQMSREDFNAWLEAKEIYAGNTKITPHWYQADSVFEAINKRRATLNLPTSAGKSLIQTLISRWFLETYQSKVLLIVPTTALVKQMHDDMVDYRLFPSKAINLMGGGQKGLNTDALITVSTWQTAVKQKPEWFAQFGLLMVDECHLATGTNISKIIKQMTHCEYKFGLSGSLKDGKTNVLQYIGLFGDVFRPVDTAKLMEDGQVADMSIKSVILRYSDEECVACKDLSYAEEIKYITAHKKRNAWVCNLARKLSERNENVLVLFKNTAHGKALYESLKATHGDRVHYIAGETKTDQRAELRGVAENETGLIIVASYGVMSTGISIKQLHHLVFSHPIKSKVIVLQSIGRVLRKHGSKVKALVWDIVDDLGIKTKKKTAKNPYRSVNYAFKHGLERIKRYNQEKFTYDIKKVEL
ncbi:MAG: DEAD/DEAH box helicase family protein [Cetobacterium sp.]|uniref:DEAD/DEAH box helicase family protein n=1 Tax=Cetobacterium sp. TaxID=2071632 RepID=UPI003EE5F1E1